MAQTLMIVVLLIAIADVVYLARRAWLRHCDHAQIIRHLRSYLAPPSQVLA